MTLWVVAMLPILPETVRPHERAGKGNFHESDH